MFIEKIKYHIRISTPAGPLSCMQIPERSVVNQWARRLLKKKTYGGKKVAEGGGGAGLDIAHSLDNYLALLKVRFNTPGECGVFDNSVQRDPTGHLPEPRC
jgi:hypothetical protein